MPSAHRMNNRTTNRRQRHCGYAFKSSSFATGKYLPLWIHVSLQPQHAELVTCSHPPFIAVSSSSSQHKGLRSKSK